MYKKAFATATIIAVVAVGAIPAFVMSGANAAPRTPPPAFRQSSSSHNFQFRVRPYTIGGRTLNIFTGPPDCTGGNGIAAGLDGLLWYTLSGSGCNFGAIVSLTTGGSATVYALPTGALASPENIVQSADAAHMWFNANGGTVDRLGSITAAGAFVGYPVPTKPLTSGITLGPDGRLWFGASSGLIGASTASGSITGYKLPATTDAVGQVTVGSDGAIWYSNSGSNGQKYGVGKISTTGAATDYATGFATSSVTRGADGNTWFTVAGQSKVGYIPTSGGTPTITSTGISGIPNQIIAGPDGNEYFDETVPSTGQVAVAKITTSGAVTEYALPYGFTPAGMTVGPDKNIWVIDLDHDQLGQLIVPPVQDKIFVTQSGSGVNTVNTYLPNGSKTTPTITAGISDPDGIFVDEKGKIYVANFTGGSLTTYLSNGTKTTPTIDGLSTPRGVAVDGSGKIYIANTGGGNVLTFNSSGSATTPKITGITPGGVFVDAAGKIYVTNTSNNTMTTYLPNGTQTTPKITGLNQPYGVAVDASGKIYIANFGNSTVTTYTANGTQTTLTISAGLSNPYGVAVDINGKIYVTNYSNGTLTTYLSSGKQTTPTISGLQEPTGVAVSPF